MADLKELEAQLAAIQERDRLNPPNLNNAGMVQNGGINNSWFPRGATHRESVLYMPEDHKWSNE